MKRRSMIKLLHGAAIAWPVTTRAQQAGRPFLIGFLETTPAAMNMANITAFRLGLQTHGYVEGRNVSIEIRSAEGRGERFPDLCAELLRLNVDVLVTRGTPATVAAAKATRTVPIVMAAVADPLVIVSSLSRPGGNVTGLSGYAVELEAKRVELLKELVPDAVRVDALLNMSNPAAPTQWREVQRAATTLRIDARLLDVRRPEDIAPAFETARRDGTRMLTVGLDALTQTHSATIAALAARHRIPTIYGSREFIDGGGLFVYAASFPDLYRRAADYVDKILRGQKPGDLPIEQPSKSEMIINLKAARALGLAVPQSLLVLADEVIE